jgi:hypothetical protein
MQNLFENWRRYLTEEQLLKEEQVTRYIIESDIEHLWENNNYEQLDEGAKDWLEGAGHVLLDILGAAGDLVTPGAGAVFDMVNMLWYIKKRCWLYAALSAISVLPYLGDLIGKGGKILTIVGKGGQMVKKIKRTIEKYSDKIEEVFDVIESNEKSPKTAKNAVPQMRSALKVFAGSTSDKVQGCGNDPE